MVVNGTSVNAPGLFNVFDFHCRQRATASHHLWNPTSCSLSACFHITLSFMRITRAPEMLIRTIFNLSYPMIKTCSTYPQRSSSRTSGKTKPIGKLAEDQVENDNNNRDRHMANNNTWLLKYIPSSMLGKWTCSKLDVSALGFTFSTTSQHTLQHNRNILARRLKRSTSHNNSSDVHKT